MSLFLLEEVIYTVKYKPDGHKTKPDQTLLNKGGENTHNNCKKVRTTLMELHIKELYVPDVFSLKLYIDNFYKF